ncbi:hypothetical protein G6O67_006630 [Ophiocordyceps sinensis]|uniref:MYND-type domain-containing protein n=1 Tax=Ophiocordyceps sinensis TaxID=72228 RepID=A0A8H4PN54_9HYPO|nr:hypothetical protein G6O67_006630 [Ophiocordyceps sinensis]
MPPSTRLDLTPRACEVCHGKDGLLRCSGCQSVYYCGRDHQLSDRGGHKEGCVAVKKALALLTREEHKLRNLPEDMWTPANVFDTSVGQFWRIVETRPYMRARFGLVDVLLQYFGSAGGRVHVVQAALDHLLDMLRLCRSDNMGLRNLHPGLDSHYDWGDMSLPFLDVKDADVLEPEHGLWSGRFLDLSHAVTVTLLKVRVLLDLQAVQNATRTLRGTVPPEIIDLVHHRLVGSVVESRPEMLRGTTDRIEPLKKQVRELFTAIDKYNTSFWRSMLCNPAKAIADRPESYSHGSYEESCLMLGYTYAAWAETPGAIDVIRALSNKS